MVACPARRRAGEIARRYDWDRSGRLVGVADSARGDVSYQYDPRDQVRAVIRPPMGRSRLGDETFAYDVLMNITASPAGTHEYHADCVTRAGGNTYAYDARGRMISKTVARPGFRPKTWSFDWDNFDRLTDLRTPEGAHWRYTYDAFSRRVAKRCLTVGKGQSTSYLWEGPRIADSS